MKQLYSVPLPAGSLATIRRAAALLDATELAAAGLRACDAFFSGNVLLLRLEGEGDDLVEQLRATPTGAGLVETLETHARFGTNAMRMSPVEGGP